MGDDLADLLRQIRFGVLALYPDLTDQQLENALIPIIERRKGSSATITTQELINELLTELGKQIGPPPPSAPPSAFNAGALHADS